MPAYDGVLVTYRHLRLAMVTVLVLLLAAVVVEWWHTGPSCWQDSVVLGLATWLSGWRHGPLWIEAVLIGPFALCWVIQTRDLWDQGPRE